MQFDHREICNGLSPNPSNLGSHFPAEGKDAFEIAYSNTEKIINCSAFRRMQGKTQVYPFPDTDAVRNRLTHSIEVAHIGQTIAARIYARVACDDTIKRAAQQIVNNGCLLHDIGNPPFGHGGEEAIREFFRASTKTEIVEHALQNEQYKNDFVCFDGNAQGFRIATTLNGRKYAGGLRLGAATLCAMAKYPYGSSDPCGKKGKFGYMTSEEKLFEAAFQTCGLADGKGSVFRSPLSLIVEAADDIAYLTADLQDAYINGDLDFSQAQAELVDLADELGASYAHENFADQRDAISEIRSLAVKNMIALASDQLYIDVFRNRTMVDRYQPFPLWRRQAAEAVGATEDRIRAKSNEKIYRGRRKVTLQVAGGRIIKFVLKMQIQALNDLYFYLLRYRTTVDSMDSDIKDKLSGLPPSLEKLADYLFDNLEKGIESRESAQVILRMPNETHRQIKKLFIESCDLDRIKAGHNKDGGPIDAELAYRLVQISLDFVSGTTDRYLNNYSKDWAGPSLT
ncbi:MULTISPECIES: dGTP triphosphohydrolase [unclassified Bradyrhizobium]|uniref:deoxyguanosinetriphosphate triphosphohydrolase family protein n=1 Tax=unclassified Bradyrhizobium TaxID=2631580 RepID=UPI0028F0E9D7|nr:MULTISPECIES: dNTP triphosphohydrolase [unclassified Bradyrhizobium]